MATPQFDPNKSFKVISTPLEQTPQQDGGFSVGQTLKNIPGSAGRLVGDIFGAVTSPFKTAQSLADVASGGLQKLIPGKQKFEPQFDAVVDFFKQRYGSIDNIKKTVQEDPVGFAADVSAVLTGGGAAIKGAGTVAKAGRVAKVGGAIQRAGLAAEPINIAGKGIAIATKPIRVVGGTFIRESLGITTGAGGEVIREAFKNPTREFRQALRGEVTTADVLTSAREGLNIIKQKRATAYTKQLAKVKGTKVALAEPFRNLKASIDSKLAEFKVRIEPNGTLDFSKSAIGDTAEAKRVGDFIETIRAWTDSTPEGLDILKQRLDDFYTPSGRGRALTTSISSQLKTLLRKEVPGYTKLTKEYAEATSLIKEIERTLSLKQGASVDTTIKKLMSSMRQNQEFRRSLVEQLDTLTKRDITSQLSGTALSPGVPSGLVGRQLFAGATVGGFTGVGLGVINPVLLSGLLLASPRIVGELLRALGLGNKAIQAVLEFMKSPIGKEILQGTFQAGRTEDIVNP